VFLMLNEPDVVHEVIDDELVLLDLRSGTYFSGNRTATVLLEALLAHPDVTVLLDAAGSATPDSRGVVEEAVTYLLAEGVLRPSPSGALPPGSLPPGASAPDAATIEELVRLLADAPPVFEKFTDMRDILLLDPVHDVGERGWPWKPGQ
jgi:hypothetical protein